jgi:hypothetical protein
MFMLDQQQITVISFGLSLLTRDTPALYCLKDNKGLVIWHWGRENMRVFICVRSRHDPLSASFVRYS